MKATPQEIINAIAVSKMGFYKLSETLEILQRLGSATAIIEHRNNIKDVLPDASDKLIETLKNADRFLIQAEQEFIWTQNNGVEVLCWGDERYPQRLKECADAPLTLFYKGSANLNKQRIISIVGTRKCTHYGQDLIKHLIMELQRLCPDVLIVSGLAYGVDINAHRMALDYHFETVGVLAHGLDYLYPHAHKETALEMLSHGGLLTEYCTNTKADKMNFVRRNRIVAGMCDACILVESALKGGGLITAGIAKDYSRDVFAFPGAVGAPYSEGCNALIAQNGAALITSASDLVVNMNWENISLLNKAKEKGIERELFPTLNTDEQKVVDILRKHNNLQINILLAQTDLSIGKLSAVLFELEMKGIVRAMAGGSYHLLML
ncbi:DNA-processing protein DprA [Hoylesella nanceiensis]|uniref:DNA-processing protein DprA n=1 Tax=Hoylesella nanceiensis TaxID=425941 RepID=UPI0028E31ED0|nr:DNA-processing protein DprA [Hoylesella nanceiensis]